MTADHDNMDIDDLLGDTEICPDLLDAIEFCRFEILIHQGVTHEVARMFALLERAKRKELALEIGAEAAALAKLKWVNEGSLGFSCILEPDEPPPDFSKVYFHGFDEGRW